MDNDYTLAPVKFDEVFNVLKEEVREGLLSVSGSAGEFDANCNRSTIIAQILMNTLGDNSTKPNLHDLLSMAEWMGPDHAQALYHAAVFITKVA